MLHRNQQAHVTDVLSSPDPASTPTSRAPMKTVLNLQPRGKRKLIRQPDRHLRMLQHMGEGNRADGILRSMDILARILKRALNHKRRGVSRLRRARVVRACVAALGLDVGDCAVLYHITLAHISPHIIGKGEGAKRGFGRLTAVTTFLIKLVKLAST